MFSKLLLIFAMQVAVCKAQQVIYTRPRPLSSLYPPATGRRVVSDERLRLPIARYFPEVDVEVQSAPVQGSYFPIADSYRLNAESLYPIPAQLVDQQRLAPTRTGDDYFAAYDYDSDYVPAYPAYADELYVQPQSEGSESDVYDDMLVNYLIRELQPSLRGVPEETLQVQRRNEELRQGVIPITSVMVVNNKKPETERRATSAADVSGLPPNNNTLDKPVSTTDSSLSQSSTSSQSLPSSAPSSLAASFSSVPRGSPKRKELEVREENDVWKSFSDAARGQKEYPLFRPAKSNRQSMWSSLEEQLSRAKNSNYKSPIPLMKKLIESHRAEKDPLQDQLDSLKIHKL